MRPSDRLLLIVGPAAVLASVDLVVKAKLPTEAGAFHHRSNAWVVLSVVVLFGSLSLTLVPSGVVAVAAGVMSGGAIGNLVSALADGNWVPNPFVIGGSRVIAFNLADVFFLVGNMLLMAALIVIIVRRRDRLAPPRAWERALLRQLRVGG